MRRIRGSLLLLLMTIDLDLMGWDRTLIRALIRAVTLWIARVGWVCLRWVR